MATRRTARPIERTVAGGWHLLTSPRLMLVWLGILLIVLLLGGILPQVPPGVVPGTPQYAQWLSQTSARWGGAVEPLRVLGLLDIFGSRVFYVLLAITGVLAGLRLLALWVPSWWHPPLSRTHSFQITLPQETQQASRSLERALAIAGQRLQPWLEKDGLRYTLARRTGAARWLPGLFYLGLLLVLLSALVGWQFGWRGETMELALGETRPLGLDELAVRLDEIAVLPNEDGTMRRLDSFIALLDGPETVTQMITGLGRRATYGNLALYQVGYGPAARVSARGEQGQPLNVHQMVGDKAPRHQARLRFSEQSQEQLLAVPEARLALRLVHYPSLAAQDIAGRVLHVQVYEEATGKLLAEQFLTQGDQLTVGGATIDLALEYYVVVRPEKEPELPLAFAGGLLALVGLCATLVWPPRETWITVLDQDDASVCRLDVPARDAEADWFRIVQAVLGEQADACDRD
ncbi:MAG: cytochrome c biogenesis protein ResB [Chloroflexi bacterium]|nr:cytochrome c biogenesis protein ResB [Chloroflexota bacterium]